MSPRLGQWTQNTGRHHANKILGKLFPSEIRQRRRTGCPYFIQLSFILYNGCFTARVNRKCFCANELTFPEEYSWKFPLNRDVLVSGEIFIKHARTRVFWPQPVGAGVERAVKSKLRRSETHRGTGGDPLGAVTASVSQECFWLRTQTEWLDWHPTPSFSLPPVKLTLFRSFMTWKFK